MNKVDLPVKDTQAGSETRSQKAARRTREKAMRRETDARVNTRRVQWKDYLAVLVIMLCLTGGQGLIFAEYMRDQFTSVPLEYILANVGYWAMITFVLFLITKRMQRRTFDRPMRQLSQAAKQVAEGDFSVYIPPLRKDGKKDYVEVMFDDFNTMVAELGSIETLKNDFIANVSHEIKTPLSVIQSYATALQKDDLPAEKRKEYTDTIITASQKMTALVTNILKLNRLEHQSILTAGEPYDLCRQLSECALGFEQVWEAKNINFSADMEDQAIIRADEQMLAVVWNNLLANALKFTEPGGTVKLTQSSAVDTVTVSVADNGCGMSEEVISHIFDQFYQGDTSHSSEGNGLGLALAKKAVELVDGTISVASKPGQGTVFTVQLPIG